MEPKKVCPCCETELKSIKTEDKTIYYCPKCLKKKNNAKKEKIMKSIKYYSLQYKNSFNQWRKCSDWKHVTKEKAIAEKDDFTKDPLSLGGIPTEFCIETTIKTYEVIE